MTTTPNIEFRFAPPAERTVFGNRGGRPVIWIGWIFTGDLHPSEVRIHGGLVTMIPKVDGRPEDPGTLRRAWDINADRDHLYKFQTRGSRTGWFGCVYVPVNVDKAIAEILAYAELPNPQDAGDVR